jgi:hypothetical protein
MSGYPANPVSVFTALRDDPDSTLSKHIGVFSDEELAQEGCQEDADEDWQNQRHMQPDVPRPVLTWQDARSCPLPDGSRYTVLLTTLDVRTGMG